MRTEEEANPTNKIELPKAGKLISVFAKELAEIIKEKNTVFYRPDSKDIVEVGKLILHHTGKEIYTGFLNITPNRFITLTEKYCVPGKEYYNKEEGTTVFKKKSMDAALANTVLCSNVFQQALPQISRIFTIPIPIIYNGELTFPKKGYDERFSSWLANDAPEITNQEMPIEEAKLIIQNIFHEFCFQTKKDYYNAIAALLTPFIRGLFSRFNIRTPIFFYIGNRERAGKDYLAGITGIVYEGSALEESPISTSENQKSNNTEELRKKLLAAMIQGRKRLHFSNNKGHINNAVFEAIATAEKYSDRLLGKNEMLTFENELDFSLSGNVGVGFTPDFANRCRFIRLFLDIEDANTRIFNNPDLHGWIKQNRGLLLSALFSLVKNWMTKGSTPGTVPFTSFPEWAKICGGIMEQAGYGNPAETTKEADLVGGDNETDDMKCLFEVCYQKHPNQWIKKSDIRYAISDETIFGYLDFNEKKDQTVFGQKIDKFAGRVLSDIRMIVKSQETRAARREFKFTKEKQQQNLWSEEK